MDSRIIVTFTDGTSFSTANPFRVADEIRRLVGDVVAAKPNAAGSLVITPASEDQIPAFLQENQFLGKSASFDAPGCTVEAYAYGGGVAVRRVGRGAALPAGRSRRDRCRAPPQATRPTEPRDPAPFPRQDFSANDQSRVRRLRPVPVAAFTPAVSAVRSLRPRQKTLPSNLRALPELRRKPQDGRLQVVICKMPSLQ